MTTGLKSQGPKKQGLLRLTTPCIHRSKAKSNAMQKVDATPPLMEKGNMGN
jgi:hypothetical protein